MANVNDSNTAIDIESGENTLSNEQNIQTAATPVTTAVTASTGQKSIIEVTEGSSIASGDNIYVNQGNALKQIDYDLLADAILNKLSSKTYSSLTTSDKTILGALSELNSKSFFNRGGTALTSESDLNNYTDFGNYYCATTSDVALIKNKPKGLYGAFSMKIFAGNGTEYPTQQMTDLDGNMWMRTLVEGEWRSWSRFSNVKDS